MSRDSALRRSRQSRLGHSRHQPRQRPKQWPGAFGLLWVGQGSSFTAPVPGTGTLSLLNAAIESEVGALVGGERARCAIDEINAELRRNLTDSGRGPRSDGPLARMQDNLEHWREVEADNFTKLSALEQQFTELTQRRRRRQIYRSDHGRADDAGADGRPQQPARSSGRGPGNPPVEAETVAADARWKAPHSDFASIATWRPASTPSRRLEAGLGKTLPQHLSQEQEARAALARTDEQLATAESEAKTFAIKEQHLERLAGALVRALRKDELVRRLKSLEDAAENLTEIDAQLSQVRISPKPSRTSTRSSGKLRRSTRSSGGGGNAGGRRETSGRRTGAHRLASGQGSHAAHVLAPTKVTVGDLAVVTVTPARHPRQEKGRTLNAGRAKLLKAAGVASATDAHAFLAHRRDLENSRRGILAELKGLKAGDDPAAACAEVKSALAEIEAAIAAALAATGRTALPDEAAIDAERLEHEQKRNALDARRASLAAAREEQLEAVGQRRAAHRRRDQARNAPQEHRGRSRALSRRRSHGPGCRYGLRGRRLRGCAADQGHNTRRRPASGSRRRRNRAARVALPAPRSGSRNHNAELMQLERDIGRLTVRFRRRAATGSARPTRRRGAPRVLAEREYARIQERIAMLQLLRNTVSGCLAEGRERYYEPVRRHLHPYLNDLFPGAELELGDGFTITGMRRSRSESLKRLSDGTQEQIAVLVRLAMGTLLAEGVGNVPIILDDALAYCDDDRINLMFDALSRAAKHQQIIVLTCRLRSFAPLGGHTLRVQTNGACQ